MMVYANVRMYINYYDCLNADNVGWRAAQEVFGQGLRHLLCRWHLDKYVNCDVPYHYYVREGKCPPLKYTP